MVKGRQGATVSTMAALPVNFVAGFAGDFSKLSFLVLQSFIDA
jgi:hypothetical protein